MTDVPRHCCSDGSARPTGSSSRHPDRKGSGVVQTEAEGCFQVGQLYVTGKKLYAGCNAGAIELLEVQLEGKKRMTAAAFLNGFALNEGETLA